MDKEDVAYIYICILYAGLPRWCAVIKNPPANAGDTRDMDSIPGSERSPGVGNGIMEH